MGTNLLEASQIVTGLVLTNKLAANAVRVEILMPPFGDVVKAFRDGSQIEEIIQNIGLGAVQPALTAAHTLNGTTNADWLGILETTFMHTKLGMEFEKIGKKLQEGKEIDPTRIRHLANQFGKCKTGRQPLSKIECNEVPFIKTGFKPFDTHFGGVPEVGLLVVGGQSGVGKTTYVRDFSKCFVKEYPKKRVVIYSLEMFPEEIAGRFRESGKLSEDVESRIEINCEHLSINDVFADASQVDNIGLVIIDFADMLVQGEVTEGKMSEIYTVCHYGAKDLHIPVILLCQFTKEYDRTGGLPMPHHIRWTSMAKILAWMQIMLYRPEQDFNAEKDTRLPAIPDMGYIIIWKSRGGIRGHPGENQGAIQLRFDGVKGWSRGEGKWFSIKS